MSEQGQNLFAKALGQGMMSLPAEDKRNLLTAIRELEAKAKGIKGRSVFLPIPAWMGLLILLDKKEV